MLSSQKIFFDKAIQEGLNGVLKNHGGPFGALIVKDKKIIAKAHNMVLIKNDPTAHAEITVIQKASKKLKTFDLSGCELYTTCFPCPMCLGAIQWANIKKIYYGSTSEDANKIGFRDEIFYQQDSSYLFEQIYPDEAKKLFEVWKNKNDKIGY